MAKLAAPEKLKKKKKAAKKSAPEDNVKTPLPSPSTTQISHKVVAKKKGRAEKIRLAQRIEDAYKKFRYCFIFNLKNQKNIHLKNIREDLSPAQIFYGNHKIMKLALVRQNSQNMQLQEFSKHLQGDSGLLFIDVPPSELSELIESYQPLEFAKSGFQATESITLQEGEDSLASFSHSMEPHLRALGLPTILRKGKICLLGDVAVCEKGDTLSTAQAQILRHLGIKMAKFEIHLVASWNGEELTELQSA